ncbi:unnamed protein product [Microthlaspi erraticum]|uniref:Uncharacterized protein n=1 Tax=Microthlaspi erraticum TaxID=1685480 RepID=A0A6D2I3L1_9BRAS|nr:unnamed protein product [Microthlaspi erraticum]
MLGTKVCFGSSSQRKLRKNDTDDEKEGDNGKTKGCNLGRLFAIDTPIWLLDDEGVRLLETVIVIAEHRKLMPMTVIVIVATHLPIEIEDAMTLIDMLDRTGIS